MKFFTSSISFNSTFITTYEKFGQRGSMGSGYCKNQEKYNQKVRTIRFLDIRIWCSVIERELVPNHVWVSTGALGYDDSGWRSKWSKEPNFYTPGKRAY